MIEQRIRIEMELIGLALEGRFVNLTDILEPKHFTRNLGANHQMIWQACKDLYPKSSINLVTLSTHLRRKYDLQYGSYLCNCLASVVSNNPAEMALYLLEFNFRDSFIELTKEEIKNNPAKREILEEILEEIQHPANDIIQLLDDLSLYSLQEKLGIYDKFIKLKKRVHKITDNIKELAQIRSLITHLKQIKGLPLDTERVLAIQELTELLIMVLGSQEMPENFNNTLKQIKNEYFK